MANMSDEPVTTTLELTADFTSLIGDRIIDDGRVGLLNLLTKPRMASRSVAERKIFIETSD